MTIIDFPHIDRIVSRSLYEKIGGSPICKVAPVMSFYSYGQVLFQAVKTITLTYRFHKWLSHPINHKFMAALKQNLLHGSLMIHIESLIMTLDSKK